MERSTAQANCPLPTAHLLLHPCWPFGFCLSPLRLRTPSVLFEVSLRSTPTTHGYFFLNPSIHPSSSSPEPAPRPGELSLSFIASSSHSCPAVLALRSPVYPVCPFGQPGPEMRQPASPRLWPSKPKPSLRWLYGFMCAALLNI